MVPAIAELCDRIHELGSIVAKRADHHLGTALGKCPGGRKTDARGPRRHEGHLSIETSHLFSRHFFRQGTTTAPTQNLAALQLVESIVQRIEIEDARLAVNSSFSRESQNLFELRERTPHARR